MASSEKDKQEGKRSTSAAGGAAALAGAAASVVHASGSDTIKVGLLGCGGRGNGAIKQNLQADPGVVVVALADLFEDKGRRTRDSLLRDKKSEGRVKIPDENLF